MRFVFFGPPGAGKGTMAVEASETFFLPHISTGEIFRTAMKNHTELGEKVKAIIDNGCLVPDDITIEMVRERLTEEDALKGWFLDGFPRTIPQAEALDKFLPEDWVIDLEVSDNVIIERLSGRRMCTSCSHSYHINFKPPKKEGICNACGSPLYIRDDDREESVKNRIREYRSQTEPLIEYYRNKGNLVPINGEPKASEVWAKLKLIMKDLISGGL